MNGLVLEGGGVKGSYQVGAYYAFRDCGIKFRGIVGTSIGSFNAAMLASKKPRELLQFWYDLDPGTAMNFDPRFVETFNGQKVDKQAIKGAFSTIKSVFKNSGFDYSRLLEMVGDVVSYEALIKSNIDYGLVTVRLSKSAGIKPIYIDKADIYGGSELLEFILASCYLPVFKRQRIIDDHYYLDGGFYDNAPFKLLTDKGYKNIFIVNIRGIGINRKIPRNVNVTYISPSRDNGKVFELNRSIIKDNIKMGYYDTLRVIKRLDGYKYCFKRKKESYYKFLCRKVDPKLVRRVMNFFDTDSYKEALVKALEYVLEKDNVDYYDVYDIKKMIKKYQKNKNPKFIYKFIRDLKFFW